MDEALPETPLFDFLALGVMITAQCPFECAHCVTNSSPRRTEVIDEALAARVIDELLPSVSGVAMTGGEPLLQPELVVRLAARIEGRVPVHVVTSGFWSDSGKKALRMLRSLRSVGIRFINISYDVWHDEFAPFEQLLRAVDLAADADIRTIVHIVGEPDDAHANRACEDLNERGIGFSRARLGAAGRAAAFGAGVFEPEAEGGCLVMQYLSLDETGILRACCGPSYGCGSDTTFYLANAHDEDVVAAVERARRDPVLAAVSVYGPIELARLAPPAGLPQHPDSPCSVCIDTLSDPARVGRLREVLSTREHRLRLLAGNLLHIQTYHRRFKDEMRSIGYAI